MDSSPSRTVGREPELERIDAALDALDGGAAACIAVEGEPGIGKTPLLSELRGRAEERGFLALSGAATEFESDLPFSVFQDALDAYLRSQELELPEALRVELAAVLPGL